MSNSFLAHAAQRNIVRRIAILPRSTPFRTAIVLVGLTLIVVLFATPMADRYVRLDIGSAHDERTLVRFHAVEDNGNEYYRWSSPVAGLFLYGFDGFPAIVNMRITSPRPPEAPPPTLSLQVREQQIGAFAVSTELAWRQYRVLAPTHSLGDTALVLDSPAFQPGYPDTRELGVALSRVEAQAVDNTLIVPPLRRTVFLLLLPLLAWLIAWRIGQRQLLACVIGGGAVGLIGWAAAYPIQSGYVLPTIWWWLWLLPVLLFAPALSRWSRIGVNWLRDQSPLALWSGVLITGIAVVALRLGLNTTLGIIGMLVGTVVTIAGLTPRPTADQQLVPLRPISRKAEVTALVVITMLAVGLRLYQLDTLPLGLWRDESRHGLLAWRIWHDPTFRPVYVVAGADLPALLFYLMSPVVGLFGPHVWSARLVSALAGALTPLALWWAARPLIGARAAIFGAVLLAWASWSLSMSRWAFPATLDQLLILTAIGLMWRGLAPDTAGSHRRQTTRSIVLLSLAALCAGLATYAYHTGRLGPIILATLTAVRLGPSRMAWRQAAPALAAALLVGLLTMAPLLHFIADDFAGYNRRVASVSVFDTNNLEVHAPARLLLRNIQRYLSMWHVSGDQNGRHHAPSAPMLDPVMGTLFLFGLGLALVRRRQRELRAVLCFLALTLISGILSGNAPHAMRSLGALAPAAMLTGMGMAALEHRAKERKYPIVPLAFFLVLCASLTFNTWLYFGKMANDPDVYGEFDVTETVMGRMARAPHTTGDLDLRNVRVFLPTDIRQSETVRFLTRGVTVGSFDGTHVSDLAGPQALLLLPHSASPEAQASALAALGPEATLLESAPLHPSGERPLFLAYGIGEDAHRLLRETFSPSQSIDGNI